MQLSRRFLLLTVLCTGLCVVPALALGFWLLHPWLQAHPEAGLGKATGTSLLAAGVLLFAATGSGWIIATLVNLRLNLRLKNLRETLHRRPGPEPHAHWPVTVGMGEHNTDPMTQVMTVYSEMADDIGRQVAQRLEVEAALRKSEEIWRFALEGAGDGVWDWNVPEGAVVVSRRGKDMLGYSDHEIGVEREHWKALVHPDDRAAAGAALRAHLEGKTTVYENEHRLRCRDGNYLWIRDRGMVVSRDAQGKPLRVIGTHTDITPFKEHERELERIAHFDALTGLANRVLLADRLRQGMVQAQRRGQPMAAVYLDLDGFKAVNDQHGHAMGDRLLQTVSERLKSVLREGDTLARLGGDEFVALLLDLPDMHACAPLLARLLAAAAAPLVIDEQKLQVSASLGVAFYPQTPLVDADALLRQADQAMYQAKLSGKNRFHVYDEKTPPAPVQSA